MNTIKNLKITCLAEDTSPKRPFWGEHGLSILVEADDSKILFDSGASGDVLLHNSEKMGLDLSNIDYFILSHSHDDHSGGMTKIANFIKSKPMYCASDAFSEHMPNSKGLKEQFINTNFLTEPKEIIPGLFATAEKDGSYSPKPTKEINLVVNVENKGLVIIVGCSHQGLKTILADAKNLFPDIPVYSIIGGLHLKDSDDVEISGVINDFKNENIQVILPNHCTGFRAIGKMIAAMPNETEFISRTDSGTFHTGQTFEF